jgi:hypothetical protein
MGPERARITAARLTSAGREHLNPMAAGLVQRAEDMLKSAAQRQ